MAAPDVTAVGDLRALLQPWRATLRSLRVGPARDETSSHDAPCVWLEWDYPRDDPGSLTRAFEAIELFTLLERADRDAWREEARALAASSRRAFSWRQCFFETWPLPRVSGYMLVVHRLPHAQPVCEYLAGVETQEHEFSPEYLRARCAFEAAMPEETSTTYLSMGLGFELGMEGWQRVWDLLPLILPLAALQASYPHGNHRLAKLRARLGHVGLPPTFWVSTPLPALGQLLQLCRHGVIVNTFPDLDLSLTRASAATFVTTIKEMLGSRQGGYDGSTRRVTFPSKGKVYAAMASATSDLTEIDHVQANYRELGDDGQAQKQSCIG